MNTVHLEPVLNKDRLDQKAEYQYTISVLNDSKDDVIGMHRSNIPFKVRGMSLQKPTYNTITVRTTHLFTSSQAAADAANLLHERFVQTKQFISQDSRIIYDYLMGGQVNQSWVMIKIDRTVSTKVLKEKGSLYIGELDLMLYADTYTEPLIHPYSKHAVSVQEGNQIAQQCAASVGIVIEIIDNDERISRRFGYMCNQVIELPVAKDTEKESGVYLHQVNNGTSECIRYELDQMESLGIYANHEEAMTNGKPDLMRQKEVTELKKELEISKIENDRARITYETRIGEIKANHEEYMRQQERKRYETKDHYEEKSYSRKNDYEGLKVGAAALAIVLSIVAIAKKA